MRQITAGFGWRLQRGLFLEMQDQKESHTVDSGICLGVLPKLKRAAAEMRGSF